MRRRIDAQGGSIRITGSRHSRRFVMVRSARGAWSIHRFASPAIAVLFIACAVMAYPKPASVPNRWELIFEPGDMRLYVDPSTRQSYWFLTYTVSNRTGKDQLWAPKLVLFTDAGEILDAGRDVPTQVTETLLD